MDWFSFIFVLLAGVFGLIIAGIRKNSFWALVAGLVFIFLGGTMAATGIDVATGGTSLAYTDGNLTSIVPDYNNLTTATSPTVNVFANLFLFGGLGMVAIVPLLYLFRKVAG